MITLLQLVESMASSTPDIVDEKLNHLWGQRIQRRTDLLLMGHSKDCGATATVHYVNRSTVTAASPVLQELVAHLSQSPQAVCLVNAPSETIARLIDFMYTGIYGPDALTADWREKKIPYLSTNVGMYTMAVVWDMPRLKQFVLAVMERTYHLACLHDQTVAIFNAWMTEVDNSNLQLWLIAWEFDAMKTAGFTIDDWLNQTERRYRHEEFEARFRRYAGDLGYSPLGV